MFLSPPEIKQQQLREKRGAYEREDVDALIDNVVGSYQHVWLERDRLQTRVEELEREMANTKELEQLLRDGLASAQRAAEQVKEEAEKQVSALVDEARSKAETLLSEARAKAEEIVAGSRKTRDRLEEETSRLTQANHNVRERYKAFLLEALKVVEATAEHKAVTPEDTAVAEADESAPVPEPDSTLEQAGWLATVPLVAATADSVDESVARTPEPAPQAEAVPEPKPEPEPEPEPEPAAQAVEDEEDVPATVLLSAVAPPEETPPEGDMLPTAESEPEPESEPEAAGEPEPEPEPETLAPDEAYMTYKGITAINAEDEPKERAAPEPEEESGDDAYEDWTPKKG